MDPAPRRRAHFLAALAILVLCLIAYANATRNGFVYDDNAIVAYNPLVKSLGNLGTIFTTGYWGADNTDSGLYRPLVIATYCVDYAMWGHSEFAFHVVNILLHAIVSMLVYAVMLRLFDRRRLALICALLFAVHPLHVEAVTGIVGRAEILVAGFTFVAILAHLRFRETHRLRYLVAAAVAYFLGLLCKESAVVLPLILALIELSGARPDAAGEDAPPRIRWRPYLAYGIAFAVTVGLRFAVLGHGQAGAPAAVSMMDNPLYELPTAQRLASAFFVLAKYLWLLVYPVRLSADYSYDQIPAILSLTDGRLIVALTCFALLFVTLLFSYRRSRPVFLAAVFFFVAILPVANLVVPIGTIMAERLAYLAALGFCLLVSYLLDRLAGAGRAADTGRPAGTGRRGLAFALAGLLLLGYTGRTILRNQDWRTDDTLFTAALDTVPRSSRMHMFMGRTYTMNGKFEKAIEHLGTSLEILPGNPDAIGELASAHVGLGEFEEAEERFREAIKIDPDHLAGYFGLGRLAMHHARYRTARDYFQNCVDLAPLYMEARTNIGVVHYTVGEYEEARQVFEMILGLDPTSLAAEYYLGLMDKEEGERERFRLRYERVAASAEPFDVEGYVYLGLICDELGLTDQAYANYVTAMSLNPLSSLTNGALARHLVRRGAFLDAAEAAGDALAQNKFAVEALQVQGAAEFNLGHYATAESLLVQARTLRFRDHLTALHLSRVYMATGRWSEAERELRRAWEFRTGDPVILLARAALERSRGRPEQAREICAETLALGADTVAVELELTRIDIAQGDEDAALSRLRRLQFRPGVPPEQLFRMALLLDRLGYWEDASRELQSVLVDQPKNARFLYQWGEILLRAEQWPSAQSTLDSLLVLYPEHPDGLNARAWLELQRDATGMAAATQALEYADRAVDADSTRAAYHDTRAEALLRLGRTGEAAAAWEQAVLLEPENPRYLEKARRHGRGAPEGSGP